MASAESAYERLGAKLLSLPDVVAQSVGFMGPVFSSAFVIPLVVGVISASGKGGGVASPLSVLIAAVGVFALGWVVSRYVKEIHAPDRSMTTSPAGLASGSARRRAGCTTAA
jgi:apolipoprotein N-acyltransferase